jgi:imidazoleglycerol-phosphate dehydratase
MNPRKAAVERKTLETEIALTLSLDGAGRCEVATGIGFFDHMLNLLAVHSRVDLEMRARGDLQVDDHHVVEDVGLALGRAMDDALGPREGIERYGWALLPMDEVLVATAIDLGGRFHFSCDYRPVRERVGDLSTELVPHFLRSLAAEGRMNLHVRMLESGENEHHRVEAIFKSLARALRMAVSIDPMLGSAVPSSKGVL